MEMEESEINDIRELNEFKGITFTEFKKCDVKKELLNNLYLGKIEPCCYWSSELICAGHYSDLWDIIIGFFSKHIHIGNPKLVIYLDLRINNFKDLINKGYTNQELRLRNNEKMRKLFCEVICILCDSKKGHCYDLIKINKEDFDLTEMTERFKAPNINYNGECYKKDDPKELFIPINELCFNLSNDSKNCISACYWMEWIIEYENICKVKKEKCKCERRTFAKVDAKFQMDIVWIIWDIFLNEASKRTNLIQKIVNSALNIFSLKYTNSCHKKRKLLLYFVISIFTQNLLLEEEMIKDKNKVVNIVNQINTIYKQIKQNEHSPNTDYLYKNVKSSNLEKTIAKLETMNSFNTEFIPRI
jgi:hypothetical protein